MAMRNIEAEIAETRAELEKTLNAIEDKFNVPKQAKKAQKKFAASYSRNPVPWIVGAVGAAVVVGGLIIWAVAKKN